MISIWHAALWKPETSGGGVEGLSPDFAFYLERLACATVKKSQILPQYEYPIFPFFGKVSDVHYDPI